MTQSLDHEQELLSEINKKIKHRRKNERLDASWAHIFLWASILASFASTIIIAAGSLQINKIIVAIIAAVPGVVIAIDKTFDFKGRAVWGAMFRIELQSLKDEFVFAKLPALQVAQKLRALERRFEELYARIGFFAVKETTKEGHDK